MITKNKYFLQKFFVGFVILLSGCVNAPKENPAIVSPRIKRSIKLTSPDLKMDYFFGDTLTISLSAIDPLLIDSIQIKFQGETHLFPNNSGQIRIKRSKAGPTNLQVQAVYQGNREVINAVVNVFNGEIPKEYFAVIKKKYIHDSKAYTQGLFFLDQDTLVESTGQYTKSTIRKVNPINGNVYLEKSLPEDYFGEGATKWNNQIFQLTWTNAEVLVYDQNFNVIKTLPLRTEGWGLTTYPHGLLLSDGSEKIYQMTPEDFSEKHTISIFDRTEKVKNINELEWHDGILYANIYGKDYISMIDIETGTITGTIDCGSLIDREKYKGLDYALNGIAVHPLTKNLWVTGKWWPFMYEIEIKAKEMKS